jgi:ribosomal protein S24E
MKSKIIKQEKNPFLQREEFVLEISSEVAPTEAEVKKEIGKDEGLIVVKKINTNFGRQKFMTEVVVYNNKEAKKKIETIPQKVRKKMEADKKAAKEEENKKAEAAKIEAEKPVEESIEETKEEEKVEEEKPVEEKVKETKKEEKVEMEKPVEEKVEEVKKEEKAK